jgi:BlaI family penicillinase repressor
MTPTKLYRTLTPQELAIMKVVWRLGSATVRDVYEALRESRRVAYTTVMTMMNILESKGYLRKDKKEKDERAYRYRPARPERTVMTAMVREFVDRVFDGASQPLLLTLVRERRLSDRERDELVRIIKEAE